MAPKRAPRVHSIARSQWDRMLVAYRERPTIQSVMTAGEVGKRIARRAIMEGWPDSSLPPFVELMSSGSTVHKEMAMFRESWEEAGVAQGEAARQAAVEAMAARIAMQASLRSMQISQAMAEKMYKRLENDEVSLPENLTPKVMLQILKALETATTVLERAMKIEQMKMGKPESILDVEIVTLLGRCNDAELINVAESGELPGRILDQRKLISAQRVMDETEAEEQALAGDPGITDESTDIADDDIDESDLEDEGLGGDEDLPEVAAGS